MERSRPHPSRQDEDFASVPEPTGPLSVPALLEVLHGPAVTKTDVDALFEALARPPAGDETPRARADLLLGLLEDARVRDFTGNDGRTVHTAAVEALVALGYPYALEVPPEALAQARAASGQSLEPERLPTSGLIAGGAAVLAQLVTAFPLLVLLFLGDGESYDYEPPHPGLALALLGVLVLPVLVTVLGRAWRASWAQLLGTVLTVLTCLGWLGISGLLLTSHGPLVGALGAGASAGLLGLTVYLLDRTPPLAGDGKGAAP